MGNSNAFDYNVYTEWAPRFVSLLLYLFGFVNMDLFVVSEKCCHPCVQSVCTLKWVNGTWETHIQLISVRKLQYGISVRYSTVHSGHRLSLLLHNHSLQHLLKSGNGHRECKHN